MKTASHRRLVLSLPLLLCLVVPLEPTGLGAASAGWVEVRSPHFRVLCDGGEAGAREVASRFEQIRSAFGAALPWLDLDPPAPLLILALADESSVRDLFPEIWKRNELKPGGFFAGGREKTFAVVRFDVVHRQSASGAAGDGYQVVYHEYTHALLDANFRRLPLWLNEGLAEFFGNTEFKDDRIYLGVPNVRAQYTRGQPLLPVERLIHVTSDSPEYQDPDKVQMFYSESWGLVHLLMVPASAERGKRLQQLVTLLQDGANPDSAFRDAVGSFSEIQQQLTAYLKGEISNVLVFNGSFRAPEAALSARRLGAAETGAELGTVQVWLHENAAARRRLQAALKDEPRPALAYEAMGLLEFSEGRRRDAVVDFERALQSDPGLYLSAYYHAMLTRDMSAANAEGQAPLRASLNHVLQLNAGFAPAYVQLAAADIRERKFESALSFALKAQQLRPLRGGYHVLIGEILHALGREREAAAVARYVAERWEGVDHDRALVLWSKLPPEFRQGPDLPSVPATPNTHSLSGRITSVSCNEKARTMMIAVDGRSLAFQVKEQDLKVRLSDGVWFGPDHFSRCHQIDGMRTTVQYRPSSGSNLAGDLVQLDIYDDFFSAAGQ